MQKRTTAMPPSLSTKLRDLRRTLLTRFKSDMLFDHDHLKLIARQMPQSSAELGKCIPAGLVGAYGDKILEITTTHERNQTMFDDCVLEIGAFCRGGMPGMARLDKVYTQILKHFKMEHETEEIFEACNLYFDIDRNRLKRKRTVTEDDSDSHPSGSQLC